MNKKRLLRYIQFILSHDYLRISIGYPGLGNYMLNSSQTMLALTDVDQLCADLKEISKKSWIEEDENQYLSEKNEPSGEVNAKNRHQGIRFYPWFAPEADPEEDNPYKQRLTIDQFHILKRSDQREYLELMSNEYPWLELREFIFFFHGNKCKTCNSTDDLAVDHILPKSKYPHLEKDFLNLQILCKSCNSAKGDR